MKTPIAVALLLLVPALALAQPAGVASSPPTAPEPLLLAPPPPPEPLLLAPSNQPPAAQQRLSLTGAPGHRVAGHSDTGLQVGEYFATLGLHLGMTATLLGVEAMAWVLSFMGRDEAGLRTFVTVSAFVAPLIMNLPPSLLAYKLSNQCGAYEHSWLFTYVSGVAVSAVSLALTAYFVTGGFNGFDGSEEANGTLAATSLVLGTVLAPALQVMVLNLTRKPVPLMIAPLLVPGGGGLALGRSF